MKTIKTQLPYILITVAYIAIYSFMSVDKYDVVNGELINIEGTKYRCQVGE